MQTTAFGTEFRQWKTTIWKSKFHIGEFDVGSSRGFIYRPEWKTCPIFLNISFLYEQKFNFPSVYSVSMEDFFSHWSVNLLLSKFGM